jgi:hypothetical protein
MVEDRKSSAHGQNDAIDPERSLHSSEANTEFQVFPGAACEEAFSLFTPLAKCVWCLCINFPIPKRRQRPEHQWFVGPSIPPASNRMRKRQA